MSFSAKLKIDNIEYNVMVADYYITQPDDGTGLPNARSVGGKIEVRIESKKGTELFEWASSNNAVKNGELIFLNRDNISTFRKVEFIDAYCLKYREYFNHKTQEPLYTDIVISARELHLKDAKFKNDWNKTS